MKKIFFAILASAALLVGCATTDYVGKTYAPTTQVDVYFDRNDIKREYSVMGSALTEGTDYLTFETMQEQLIEDAKARGADGILIEGMETVKIGETTSTQGDSHKEPEYVATKDGKIKNVGGDGHYSSVATTTEIKDKVIRAKLIKYQ